MEDAKDLNVEELERVSGGMKVNDNGKTELSKGDCFVSRAMPERGYIVLRDQKVGRYDIVEVGAVNVKTKEKEGWAQYQFKFLTDECTYSPENNMPDFSLY